MADIKIKDAPSITPKATYKIPVGNTEYNDARTISVEDLKDWMSDLNGGGGFTWATITGKPSLVQTGQMSTINGQSLLTGTDIQVTATTIDWNNVVNKPTIPENTSDLNNDSGFVTETTLQNDYQQKLVSGSNIATVNGYNLLSGGNIVISGGGGGNLDYTTIGTYTPQYIQLTDSTQNNVIPLSLKPIKHIQGQNINMQFGDGFLYVFEDLLTDLTFTLATPANNDYTAEYHFIFTSDTTPTTINWAVGLKFTDGNTPTIEASKTYEINIINNCVLIQSYV